MCVCVCVFYVFLLRGRWCFSHRSVLWYFPKAKSFDYNWFKDFDHIYRKDQILYRFVRRANYGFSFDVRVQGNALCFRWYMEYNIGSCNSKCVCFSLTKCSTRIAQKWCLIEHQMNPFGTNKKASKIQNV